MKLVTFLTPDGARHIGSIVDGGAHVSDFSAVDPIRFANMLALIDGGDKSLAQARELDAHPKRRLASSGLRLLAPLEQPRRLRDFLCFERHFRQSRANRYLFGAGSARLDPASVDIPAVWYDRPVYYKGNCFSIVGHEAAIAWPSNSRVIDFELEIGLVTSRRGKNISEQDAPSHVFGYTIFNDFSARDLQYEEMSGSLGPAKGKDFDTGNALGPWLVTADEVGDPQRLEMILRVNGEEWGRGNSSEMHHSFCRMVSYASSEETLYPGEILGSGTVGGGSGNEHGRFLRHGDVVELEVEKLGVLRNRIDAPHVAQPPAFPVRLFAAPTA
jgi:2-keto-4-pentenoate hydratase/2-oxohepta-3-ene-1,7-dioic acid hydratase in catechol pathway